MVAFRRFAGLAILVGLLGLAPVTFAQSSVRAALAELEKARKDGIEVGFSVARLRDGTVLGAIESATPMVPASNVKVLTVAAALLGLGPDHEMFTDLIAHGDVVEGRLDGPLRLRGEGDPSLRSGGDASVLRLFARETRARGIRRIGGDLLVDDRLFPDARVGPAWPTGEPTARWMAEVAALSVDHGCVEVAVSGTAVAGGQALVLVRPAGVGVSVVNRTTTTRDASKHVVDIRRSAPGVLTVSGSILANRPEQTFEIAVEDPALAFGRALAHALREEGVALEGSVRRPEPDAYIEGGQVVHRVRTALRDVIQVLLEQSQNQRSECLAKHLGATLLGEGTFAGAGRAIRGILSDRGVALEGMVLADGSGLSRDNRITAGQMVAVLGVMWNSEHRDRFRAALPAPGEGTLERRLRDLGDALQAKTGTLNGVSALSGYLARPGDEPLVFSLLTASSRHPTSRLRALQDRVARLLFGQ